MLCATIYQASYGKKFFGGTLIVAGMLLLQGCSQEPEPLLAEVSCQDVGDIEVVCGFHRPEDLELTPDGSYLIVSEMNGTIDATFDPGRLSFYDLRTRKRITADLELDATPGWGDPNCQSPEHLDFSPHGIYLQTQTQHPYPVLAVVSHYPREAIEIFSLQHQEDGRPYLVWRGCLIPPGMPFLNDVAITTDGTFYFTHMFDRDAWGFGLIARLVLSWDTGFVWSWSPATGYNKVPGSDGSFPNGISLDPDAGILLVNYYTDNLMQTFSLETGNRLGAFEIQFPDNVSYVDGVAYVASHQIELGGSDACAHLTSTCPLPYSIYRIDPVTLEGEQILYGDGPPFGLATVAIPVERRLWMGSFTGDRIASAPLAR
ncbi:MAG: hypothetical protein ACR2PW_03570 [Gammaproteobacteria bacterium]